MLTHLYYTYIPKTAHHREVVDQTRWSWVNPKNATETLKAVLSKALRYR